MKGQKSLAMIFSMILMSICIVMIIGIVQESSSNFQNSESLRAEVRSAGVVCDRKCSEVSDRESAVQYCAEMVDLGSNNVLGSGYNSYCGDGAKCFNIDSCKFNGMELNAGNCKNLMCSSFQDDGLSQEDAGKRVYEYFEKGRSDGNFGAGTCNLNGIRDSADYRVVTWWSSHFQEGEEGDFIGVCE
jgi:hypothetical protein